MYVNQIIYWNMHYLTFMFIEFHLTTTCISNPLDSLNLSNTKSHIDLHSRTVSLPQIARWVEDIADRACLPFFLACSLSILLSEINYSTELIYNLTQYYYSNVLRSSIIFLSWLTLVAVSYTDFGISLLLHFFMNIFNYV